MILNDMLHYQRRNVWCQNFSPLYKNTVILWQTYLSLVIKMGQNVKKCTIYLYNIPENTAILEFTSIAWSYDSQGPIKGSKAVVVM
jgi:hypothetical protein